MKHGDVKTGMKIFVARAEKVKCNWVKRVTCNSYLKLSNHPSSYILFILKYILIDYRKIAKTKVRNRTSKIHRIQRERWRKIYGDG